MQYIIILLLLFLGSCGSKEVGQTVYSKNKPTIIPDEGLRQGNFYRVSKTFTGQTAGHTGVLWAIHNGEKLVDIYFDEQARKSYHTRVFAGEFKRLNHYDNMMAKYNKGVGWFIGVRAVEKQLLAKGELTQNVDTVSGASNTPQNGMLPLVQMIQDQVTAGSSKQFAYRLVRKLDDGTYGDLLVVLENNKIVDFEYDELIPEDIKDSALIPYAGQSRKFSTEYKIPTPARYGFFYTADQMKQAVIQQNNLDAVHTVFEDKFHASFIRSNITILLEELQAGMPI